MGKGLGYRLLHAYVYMQKKMHYWKLDAKG